MVLRAGIKKELMKRIGIGVVFGIFLSFPAVGQKMEYRNDSLFVNGQFVDAQTPKEVLDRLLGVVGKTKTSKEEFRKHPNTGKKGIRTTHFYYKLGLFFRTYEDEPSQLSVGIKLYRDTDLERDQESELKAVFKGQLYVAENFLNDQRTMEQLRSLKNCSMQEIQLYLGTFSMSLGAELLYKESVIRLSLDSQTKELKEVFIHHNFKDQ
jgi:hypothetical protein